MSNSDRIDEAIEDLSLQLKPNINATAKKFGIPRMTLSDRWKGKSVSRAEANSTHRQCLTNSQEQALIELINSLTSRGMPPTSAIVRNLAEEIKGGVVGKNWTGEFVKRHKTKLKSLYLSTIDNKRVKGEYTPSYELFYQLLENAIKKHHITANNIYNVDKKGFLIGIGSKMRRIINRQAYEKGQCRQSAHNGNREFITLIACVNALGLAIPPTLLYKGESGDLQDSWVEELGERDDVVFGAIANGWSDDAYGIQWLKIVFEPNTVPKRKSTKRLLIVNGHSSHVNLSFINWASNRGIIILILPPHSTQRLRPLDVNCFSPLASKYQVNLDKMIHESLGLISISKRKFYGIFWPAWNESFSVSNIQGGFQKTGIWPLAPRIVLDTIERRPTTPPDDQNNSNRPPPTPLTSKSIRRAQRLYRENPIKENLNLIFQSQERLAAQHEIDRHIQKGLLNTLKDEKKRRQRGKRLNLIGEDSSSAQLFDADRVRAAKAFQAQKEALAIEEKTRKGLQKLEAKESREKRETEAQERALQHQVEREAKAQARAEKLAQKEAAKTPAQQLQRNEKKSFIIVLQYKKPSIASAKVIRFVSDVGGVPEEEGSNMVQSRKREISLPQRFRN